MKHISYSESIHPTAHRPHENTINFYTHTPRKTPVKGQNRIIPENNHANKQHHADFPSRQQRYTIQ